jgi:hypothetical protein
MKSFFAIIAKTVICDGAIQQAWGVVTCWIESPKFLSSHLQLLILARAVADYLTRPGLGNSLGVLDAMG